jgi:hypothetical protein
MGGPHTWNHQLNSIAIGKGWVLFSLLSTTNKRRLPKKIKEIFSFLFPPQTLTPHTSKTRNKRKKIS